MISKILRYCVAGALAVVVTFGLFLLMQSLIEMGQKKDKDATKGMVIDFIRVKKSRTVQIKKRVLPQKLKQEKPPDTPDFKMPTTKGAVGDGIKIAPPAEIQVDKGVRLAGGPGLHGAASDSSYVPMVRINPMYPRAAARKRVEGWVLLQITISVTGAVKNARVIEAKPPNIFNRSAVNAINRWKYKPTIRKGVPIEIRGVQVRLTFKLEN